MCWWKAPRAEAFSHFLILGEFALSPLLQKPFHIVQKGKKTQTHICHRKISVHPSKIDFPNCYLLNLFSSFSLSRIRERRKRIMFQAGVIIITVPTPILYCLQGFSVFWYRFGETLLIFSILNNRDRKKQYKRLMFQAVYKVSWYHHPVISTASPFSSYMSHIGVTFRWRDPSKLIFRTTWNIAHLLDIFE